LQTFLGNILIVINSVAFLYILVVFKTFYTAVWRLASIFMPPPSNERRSYYVLSMSRCPDVPT